MNKPNIEKVSFKPKFNKPKINHYDQLTIDDYVEFVEKNRTNKSSYFSKKSRAKDTDIFEYLQNHSETNTRKKFGIGLSRINRIKRQLGLRLKRKRRRVTKELEAFIVEFALDGIISSTMILREIIKRFPETKISRSTIIRVLADNKFRFRKPRHIQFLTKAHKFNRYNFSYNMLNNHRNLYKKMLFTDECRFCHTPDNRSMWIRSNDFREEKCARYTKYTFGTMV